MRWGRAGAAFQEHAAVSHSGWPSMQHTCTCLSGSRAMGPAHQCPGRGTGGHGGGGYGGFGGGGGGGILVKLSSYCCCLTETGSS